MLYRTLGRTGLRVSLAGLGTGGPSRLGQATGTAAADSVAIVREALELGINLLDTSPAYQESEVLLGQALQGVPRDRYVLATKYPPRLGADVPPDDLMRSVERSLQRLGVETIDVLQYHGVSPANYEEVLARHHTGALKAVEQGKVRYIGITETMESDPEHLMLSRALRDDLFDTCMIHYGVFNQSAERAVYPLAQAHNVGVFVMGPVRTSLRSKEEAAHHIRMFQQEGWLAGSPPDPDDPLGLGGELSITQAAYQFAAAHPSVSTVLCGTGNIAHLRRNAVDIVGDELSAAQVAQLRARFGGLTWKS